MREAIVCEARPWALADPKGEADLHRHAQGPLLILSAERFAQDGRSTCCSLFNLYAGDV